jgi:sulfotransferase family protein
MPSPMLTNLELSAAALAPIWRGDRISKLRPPNVIGVGSGRSGTTYLYGLLQGCPDVYVTPVKEPNYFGIGSTEEMTFREYKSLFIGQTEEPWIAEVTPIYLSVPGALEEIRARLGQVRIIINVREPLSRLVSHFHFHREFHGCETFEKYLSAGLAELRGGSRLDWCSPAQGIRMSLYARDIKRALQLFGLGKVLVLSYEELARDLTAWPRQLQDFLVADFSCVTVAKEFINAGGSRLALGDVLATGGPALYDVAELFAEDLHQLEGFIPHDVVSTWRAQASAAGLPLDVGAENLYHEAKKVSASRR